MQLRQKIANIYHLIISALWTIINGYPSGKLFVIGVTGTDGKTTTCHLIYEIFKASGIKVGLISSIGAFAKNKKIDTGLHVTTPDAKLMQPLLRRFVDMGTTHMILEVTSHGLDQNRLFGCNFSIGVITNVSHEHLDYHGTFEEYRKAKMKLLRNVKWAILNADDESFDYFKEKIGKGIKLIGYRKARVKNVSKSLKGEYNLYNIKAAMSVCKILELPRDKVNMVVQNFRGVEGRREDIDTEKGFRVVIDFAHTPNGLRNILLQLKNELQNGKRLIAIFGSAGDRYIEKRPMMGEISAKLADISIFTAEDPRSENVNQIIEQIAAGALKAGTKELFLDKKHVTYNDISSIRGHLFTRIPKRGEAISFAIQKLAKRGDIVVICGKGHEKSMAYGKVEYPWSDHEAVRFALEGKVLRIQRK